MMSGIGQNLPAFRFRNVVKQELGLAQNASLRTIVQDSHGFLWIGTGKGLYRYDGVQFKGYFPRDGDHRSISDTEIMSIFRSTNDRIWIGTALHGIDVYEPHSDQFDRLAAFPDSTGRIWSFAEDGEETIWIGSDYGLVAYKQLLNESQFYTLPESYRSDRPVIIRSILVDREDKSTLWLGTSEGLFSFDKSTQVFRQHPLPFERQYHLTQCVWGPAGYIWCASGRGGLLRFEPNSGTWRQYNMPEFLKGRTGGRYNAIQDLALYHDRYLWIAAFDGLGIFNIASFQFTMFDMNRNNPFMLYPSESYRSVYALRDSNVFIGGVDMLAIAYRSEEPTAQAVNRPAISSIQIDDNFVGQDSNSSHITQLKLMDHEIDLSISLSMPEFALPEHVQYRHILEGYDQDWVMSGSGRLVRYTNLGEGNYIFRYQASTDGIRWIDGYTQLKIEKIIPLWKKPFFIGLCLALVIGLLLIVHSYRMGKLKQEAAKQSAFEKKLAEMEMTALRAQMNPHFIFNALSSIKYFILESQIENANTYLTKFGQLIRAVLKNSKSKLVTLSDEIHALKLYIDLEAVRFTEQFEYEVDVQKHIDQEEILIPPLLIQPYVENAIWHGLLQKNGPGQLWVKVKINKNLNIQVEDNGIGRERAKVLKSKFAKNRKSLGMQITKDRIGLIKESIGIDAHVTVDDLYAADGSAKGTLIHIVLPVIKKNPD
jgi:streptogramin lyase